MQKGIKYYSLFLLFLLITVRCFAQSTPKVISTYLADHGFFGGERLTLGSDDLFFYSSSCECGTERFGKGTWEIKRNKLYLYGVDSASAFPQSNIIEYQGSLSNEVIISTKNHYGLPIRGLTMAVLRDTNNISNVAYFHTDSTGVLLIDKSIFKGFYLIYECHPSIVNIGDTLKVYMFKPTTEQYSIFIDFADAGFDREPIAFDYGSRVYRIRKNKLLHKNKAVFVKL